MGGLALTVCFTFGWIVWRMLRWAFARLGRRAPAGRKKKTAARVSKGRQAAAKASARASSKATPRDKEKAPSRRDAAAAGKDAARRDNKAEPSPPWRLTMALAPLRGAWPLAVLLAALYGGGRLVAHGMVARPQHAPDAFRQLVEAVGWGAMALVGVALVGLLASWRCRRHA
ncbi:hypothetical protein CVH10_01970 [Halomonas sp. ND22Bw]|uniref:Uncharacterized protein n=2 Tax=Halomonadaceae TaxID=28256 RepID=A0ABR4WQZ9_9GAMM|nr:hypothetical protein FP66_12220 [Halomonas salina]PSJ23646.1 hypothetical protein CVH10_01970 [Halomonas sp. ND22Bw]